MLESPNHLRKRKYSTCIKKTKEEQEKELEGIPKNIGPYELIEKLKDGGYSKIYKAKSCYTGDFVSIKAIEKLGFQESVEDVLLMIRQAEVLKILKHRNLVNLYEIYESQKYFYMIMDYLPNGDLIEQIIKKKRFQEHEALAIFSQLVDALYYMHKNEICHRDIRTEKILFDKKNKPKLVGFSYSTFYTKGKKIKESYGSLCYACPEIIQNDYYNPELADVWSLGVVLYVMVCGYLPFSEDDDEENKHLIINGKVDYPLEISNKVKDLLKHMLEIDPNKRYTFQKIVRHPWFKPFNEATLTGGCNPYKMIYPVDERILRLIVIYGFNKKEVDKDLKQNIYNCRTGLYRQLTDKLLYMGFTSFSDLCSDDFIQFSREKENIISDGEIKYKKLINKILERIKKVERYVDDYRRKEDKIIKDLENIYNEAIEEEMRNNKEIRNNMKNIIKNYSHLKTENYMNKECDNKNSISKIKKKKVDLHQSAKEKKFKSNIYDNIEIKNNHEINEDFDLLKAFNEENKLNANKKNSTILSLEGNSFDINNYKIKRTNSNPNIKDFIQKLIEKDDRSRDLYDLDSELYEEDLNAIRNSKRKRQLSVMVKRKKRNYLNTGSENDYFLKKPKDSSERKKIIENNYKKSIKHIIMEENVNEEKDKEELNSESSEEDDKDNNLELNQEQDNKIINDSNNKKDKKVGNNKRKNSLRFSLSFGDDEEEEEEDENNSLSKIESKRVSMCDIDEEIKELKEIKNNIKSPIRNSFLKRNSNDKNLINFNMESNSSIFGEHLQDNVSRKNSNAFLLESINEKYDLLTELKRLSEKANEKKKISKNEEKNKKNDNEEIKEFNYDSFGETKNEKEEGNLFDEKENEEKNKNNQDNNNLIIFDDKLEISFHDEKSDNKEIKNMNNTSTNLQLQNYTNTKNMKKIKEFVDFFHDKIRINRLYIFNQFEELLCNINNLNLKKENQFNYKFIKDKYCIKKLDITNEDINMINLNPYNKEININNNMNDLKNKKVFNTINNENQNMFINITKNIVKNKVGSESKKKKIKQNILGNNHSYQLSFNLQNNDKDNNYKNNNINNSLNNKNNNSFNFYNQNDNFNQKIYIFDSGKTWQRTPKIEKQIINNQNIKNNIIINSNINTINNISIKNKNNYHNNRQQNSKIKEKNNKTEEKKKSKDYKINYTNYINSINISKNYELKLNKKSNQKNNLIKLTKQIKDLEQNKKIKVSSLCSEEFKTKKKRNSDSNKNSIELNNSIKFPLCKKENIKMFSDRINYKNKKNIINNQKSLLLPKNLFSKFNDTLLPFHDINKNRYISLEKAFHYSIISDENEIIGNPEKFISKIKKGHKYQKLLSREKADKKKSKKYYNKFVNFQSSNKNNSKYSGIYLNKLNFDINNYNKNNYDFDESWKNQINPDIINNVYINDKKIDKFINSFSRNFNKRTTEKRHKSQEKSLKIKFGNSDNNNEQLYKINKTINK